MGKRVIRTFGAALLCFVAVAVLPASAAAQCTGDCSSDLLAQPKSVEKFAKKAWKAIQTCAKKGVPACPSACTVPDGTISPYALNQSCADLVLCNLGELAGDAYGATWDGAAGCPVSPATDCGNARGKHAGKLVVKKLKRRRTSKMDKLAKDRTNCATKTDKKGACDGQTVCAAPGAWIDEIVPILLRKGGYQLLPFNAASGGEAKADLLLSAETADWGTKDAESVVLDYDVDGVPLGQIVVYNGQVPTDYRMMLGSVSAGPHLIGLRHNKKLSPAKTSAVLVEATALAETLPAGDPSYDPLRFAPMLLGIDTKLNPIASHPGNAVSDVPLVMYVKASPGTGMMTYRYVMIWSNEDGGTGNFPDNLMTQYGRTTDIENIVEVDVSDAGALLDVRYRPDESGSLATFAGSFFDNHPIVRTYTENGLIADDGESTLRFALAPLEFDDTGLTREQGMDLDPVSYVVMAKEMIREGKVELTANPAKKKLSDQRNYLFIEYDIDIDVAGNVLRAYAIASGTRYRSDHNQPSSGVLPTLFDDGRARTAIELPVGTTLADISEFGIEGLGSMSGTLYLLDGFMLGADFLPGTHVAFGGALAAGGLNPVWPVSLP